MPGKLLNQKMSPNEASARIRHDNTTIAKGAGLAFLGKLGTLFEPLSVFVFAKLYGAPALGLFFLLWGYVSSIANGSGFAMMTALQRFVPSEKDETEVHRVAKAAILIATLLSLLGGALLALAAPYIAPMINAEDKAAGDLVTIIRIYAWTLPLWAFLEVSTAAVRARQAFGPEIRIRIFYEQGIRFGTGIILYLMGMHIYGLFLAHLLALATTNILSLKLLSQHYSLRRMKETPLNRSLLRKLIVFGAPMMLSNLLKALHTNLPIFVLNIILPGATGATAVAVYSVARRLVSILQVVRQSFEYVLAPLASARNAEAGSKSLHQVYAFATRLIFAIFLPFAMGLVLLRADLLTLIGPAFMSAGNVILILSIGRLVEAASGPAPILIDMLGKYWLPLVNAATGVGVSAILLWVLVPAHGLDGAAIAAAVGINVTGLLSSAQVYFIYSQQPYDRQMLQPMIYSLLGSLLIWIAFLVANPWGLVSRIAATSLALLLAFALLLKWGFDERDASAFGKLSRWLRN